LPQRKRRTITFAPTRFRTACSCDSPPERTLYDKEKQKGNANRATSAVARNLVAREIGDENDKQYDLHQQRITGDRHEPPPLKSS
jgi:hypothetical protein